MTPYAITAMYYDAMAGDSHGPIDAQIAAALAGVPTAEGPVVDIGAGTGLTTRVIATALPTADIWAVEPDASMRPALLTRVFSDADLRRRVTIVPLPMLAAPLPERIAAAVASAAVVHFSGEERARLWAMCAARLAPAGRIVIEVQCPQALDQPERLMAVATSGRAEYRGYASAVAIGEDRQRWTVTYRTAIDNVEIERCSAEFVCWTVSAERLVDEARVAGLHAEAIDDLVVMRPLRQERSC